MAEKLTVHDPRGIRPGHGQALAPRLPSLEGNRVYLVDCLFDNSEVFVDQLRQWFAEHMPGVKIKRIAAARELGRRPGDVRRIQADGDAAILGGGSLKHL